MFSFQQNAFSLLEKRPSTYWEWLFIMQHHGVSTRLLDWSESPLAGLYFALDDPKKDRTDGLLWMLLPTELNKISNINSKDNPKLSIPAFGDNIELNLYTPQGIKANTTVSNNPIAAIALRNNPKR